MDFRPATIVTLMTSRDGTKTAVVSLTLARAATRVPVKVPLDTEFRDGQQIVVAVSHGDEVTYHSLAPEDRPQEPQQDAQEPVDEAAVRQWCRDVVAVFGACEIRVYETDGDGDRWLVGSNVKGEVR
jgi:hypothetical protein